MMSKKQWFVLLCVFMCYILFGAAVFYTVESKQESQRLQDEEEKRQVIEELLQKQYVPSKEHSLNEIYYKLSCYCDKPFGGVTTPHTTTKLTWTFYHSVFFILTIVSTIGYGNLAPTTPFTRTFMILYGIIGIPINGIVIITLGDYFAKSFLKLHKRWKSSRVQHALATLGLIGQIILYIIPGLTFFILIPSLVIVLYEDWTFALAVEFAFATLTTVGVGHQVPGTNQNEHSELAFTFYRIFLLIWIILGLGYLAMVFGFISRGLRSKQMHALEHKLVRNIKKTNRRIRQELRSVLNEYLLMKVKPIYRDKRYTPIKCGRTQSCPDLRIHGDLESPRMRKRAYSELAKPTPKILTRIQSDTDLERIDKERTFIPKTDDSDSNKLILRVVNALGNYNDNDDSDTTSKSSLPKENYYLEYDIFDTDNFDTECPIVNRKLSKLALDPMRPRAASESKKEKAAIDFNLPSKYVEAIRKQELIEKEKYGKARSRTLPPIIKSQNFFTRLKNTFKQPGEEKIKTLDIESQSDASEQNSERSTSTFSIFRKEDLLEETSLADFFRALTRADISEISGPRRKYGIVHSTVAPRTRRHAIKPASPTRKTSLSPCSPSQDTKQRRFSLSPMPSVDNSNFTTFSACPPISEASNTIVAPKRKFSSKSTAPNTRLRRMSQHFNSNNEDLKFKKA